MLVLEDLDPMPGKDTGVLQDTAGLCMGRTP